MSYFIYSKEKRSSGRANLNVAIIACLFVLFVFYLIQINNLVSQGYSIKEYEKKIQNLERENQELQIELTKLRSPERLAEAAKGFEMVQNKAISYLVFHKETVAQK